MLNQKELISLNKGDIVKHFLLIKKCDVRTSRTNKPYLALELADSTLTIQSNVWENFDSFFEKVKNGDIVFVTGFMEEYMGAPQVRITNIRFSEPSDKVKPSDFLEKSKRDLSQMKDEFFNRVESISNPM